MVAVLNSARSAKLLALIVLTILVGAVFYPIVGYEFVGLDVDSLVVNDPSIRALTVDNVKQIFTVSMTNMSYYPVRTLTFALDYHVWGLDPGGFKLTNGLIHLGNVFLVFWLVLRALGRWAEDRPRDDRWQTISVAAFSAGLFAVHPLVVEPVAWVLGRDELLSSLGALACVHFYITARRLEEAPGKFRWAVVCYCAATLCLAAACLSNVRVAVFPAIVVAWDVLTLAKPTVWRILSTTAALWGIGLATLGIQKFCKFIDVHGEPAAFAPQRLTLILTGYWLNLRSLVWPTDLAIFRWEVPPEHFFDGKVIPGAIAVCLTLAVLWKVRRRKPVLFGLLWFVLALAPSSQVVAHHVHRADRFLYLPLAGLVVALAAALVSLGKTLKRPGAAGAVTAGTLLLLVLGARSAAQVRTWKNASTMWENSVRTQPENAAAHCALGDALAKSGQFLRAKQHYEKAIELLPHSTKIQCRLALLLAECDEPVRDYDRALELARDAFDRNPSHYDTLSIVCGKYAQALASRGDLRQAAALYREAIQRAPANRQPMIGLAQLLIGSGDERLRDPEEAVRLARRACDLPGAGPEDLTVLAAAYAAAGRFDHAVRATQKAIAAAAGDASRLGQLRRQLNLYQKRLASSPEG